MAIPSLHDITETSPDESLMSAFAAGNAKAFETLYDRHHLAVWRFVLRSVGEPATADDVTQELWIAVANAAERYQPSAKFRTWLFTMARNRVIDLSRTQKSQVSIDAEDDDGSPMFSELTAESRLGPLRQLESSEVARDLLQAIEALPAEQREAFLLQAEADMSVLDIASATSVSFETAKSRLRYARNALKALLSAHEETVTAHRVAAHRSLGSMTGLRA